MIIIEGIGASQGITMGKLQFLKPDIVQINRHKIEDAKAELQRLRDAKETAIEQLGALYETAMEQVGEQGAQLFEVHQMMLDDDDYCDAIENIVINQGVNAEYAVSVTGDNFSKMFAEMDDSYMQARAADINDISERLIKILCGVSTEVKKFTEPIILAADDLAPSETVQLEKDMILGFATRGGSKNSHTAILARTMGIPAVLKLGEQLDDSMAGKLTGIDGFTGKLYIDLDKETIGMFDRRMAEETQKKQLLEQFKGRQAKTQYGQQILTYANIGSTADLGAVILNDAEGVGLFRTEFLYLESNDYPTETEQFTVYRTVVETLAGKRVIFRTLDIGADKQADYFKLPAEENPAMGLRAIRICLTREEVFKEQLRALLKASGYGKVAIMFPMITSLGEIHKIKRILEETKQELRDAGIEFDEEIEIGIMIETPAAALISNQLAQEVDFFSVGTNDLTQYLLAIDRQNQSLEEFYDPYHPALIELIRISAENAHRHGKWIGICGELAADLSLTETFLALGIDELSVAPGSILPLRAQVCGLSQDRKEEILAKHMELF